MGAPKLGGARRESSTHTAGGEGKKHAYGEGEGHEACKWRAATSMERVACARWQATQPHTFERACTCRAHAARHDADVR